jgi:uncharacterized 2Fe-2S/4Fe-4S cluster protein (DUF4445 family)
MIVLYEPEGRRVEAQVGENLLDVAHRAGVGIRTDCGGKGTCGKCKIAVDSQRFLCDLSQLERRHLTNQEILSNYRLACAASIMFGEGRLTVSIPPESKQGIRRFQVIGMERHIRPKPAIGKIHITLQEPTLQNPMPDVERVVCELKEKFNLRNPRIDLNVVRYISKVLRDAEWEITVTIWKDKKIICVEEKNTTNRHYGFAVDIGTSKIVGNLVDLQSGETLFANAVENPQLPYGEDIMSRITYSSKSSENLQKMSMLVRNAINDLLVEGCTNSQVPVDPAEVYEIAIVGNTVMHHIFLSIPPFYLSQAPYVPTVKRPIDIPSRELGMKGNPGSSVHVLPVIAGFVGADAVADVIATGIHRTKGISLLIDIGTNTEVFLGNKDELICCSCASGPAFEGMHIRHGMKAVSGAIERVEVSPGGSEVAYETIDGGKAIGICGSGIIDIVASLFKQGIINKRGYFVDPAGERFIIGDRGIEFIVARSNVTAGGEHLTVSEEDILAILLAKAAIEAGCNILMKKRGIDEKQIDQVLIAGAFGNHLNVANARTLGLIPEVPTDKVALVGNVSISGAKMCLLSTKMRGEALSLSKKTKYVELAAEPGFAKEFSYSLFIPHKFPRRQ